MTVPLLAHEQVATYPRSAPSRPGGAPVARRRDRPALAGMVGRSPAMRSLGTLVARAAATSLPVLLRGETGTGKELCARAVHDGSPRAARPFVALSGATVTSALGLSTLFGHVAGAFTGALGPRAGAFREASGGTLFIDEVAALPRDAQSALLRVLEERVVTPLGADRGVEIDVRLVTATCEPIEDLTQTGAFRLDLYQRLAGCVVTLPPLRERREDIPLLAAHLLATSELAGCGIDPTALELFANHPLPGNVRELKNLLLQAALRCDDGIIRPSDVAAVLAVNRPSVPPPPLDAEGARQLLEQCAGNISAAARRAGLARSTFRDRLLKGGTGEP
jgi:DNA-binding NtrC family response regulator